WLAVPALAVSLVSLRVRLPLGVGLSLRVLPVPVGLSLRVLPGAVLRLRPIVVVELLRADLRWITRTVFGVVGHVRHRFRSDTVCTPPPESGTQTNAQESRALAASLLPEKP